MLVVFILLFVTLSICLFIEIKRRNFHRNLVKIPGLKEYPIIGNANFFQLRSTIDFERIISYICPSGNNRNTFFGYQGLIFSDPEISKQILLSSKFLERSFMFDSFGVKYSVGEAKCELSKKLKKKKFFFLS